MTIFSAKEATAKRIIHLRVVTRSGDHKALSAFLRQAIPFYESLPGVRVRLLRNINDQGHYIEVVEYDTIETFEIDEQRLTADPRMKKFIQRWRRLLEGGVEVEIYEDVTETI